MVKLAALNQRIVLSAEAEGLLRINLGVLDGGYKLKEVEAT